ERNGEERDRRRPRRRRDEQERAEAGRDTAAAAAAQRDGPAVTGDREHRGHGLSDRTPSGPLRKHQLREDDGERPLENVEDRNEKSGAGAERAERVRRTGGAGADVAQIHVSVDATDDVPARDRADAGRTSRSASCARRRWRPRPSAFPRRRVRSLPKPAGGPSTARTGTLERSRSRRPRSSRDYARRDPTC